MALEIIRKDNRFWVIGQGISLGWLADIPANRKLVLVFLRWVRNSADKPRFWLSESKEASSTSMKSGSR
jgi:hypothetical protein